MVAQVKFDFGTAFDEAGRQARLEAERAMQAEREALQHQSFEEGVAAGRQDALAGLEAQTLGTTDAILAALASQMASLDVARADMLAQCAELARLLGIKLAGKLVERYPVEAVAELVQRAFAVAAQEPRLVIRVADSLLDPVKQKVEAQVATQGYAGRVIFLAQDDLAPGDVRIEWADGGAERIRAQMSTELDHLVTDFLESKPEGAGDLS